MGRFGPFAKPSANDRYLRIPVVHPTPGDLRMGTPNLLPLGTRAIGAPKGLLRSRLRPRLLMELRSRASRERARAPPIDPNCVPDDRKRKPMARNMRNLSRQSRNASQAAGPHRSRLRELAARTRAVSHRPIRSRPSSRGPTGRGPEFPVSRRASRLSQRRASRRCNSLEEHRQLPRASGRRYVPAPPALGTAARSASIWRGISTPGA